MIVENGEWIIHGLSWNDPYRIRSPKELVNWINEAGFLPLFGNGVKGFSVEEHVSPDYCWTGDREQDPWEWREIIDEMTRPRIIEHQNWQCMEYGYLWLILDREKSIYAALGNSRNVIYINPEKNIVISVASYFKPAVMDRVDFIREYIEPFVCKLI